MNIKSLRDLFEHELKDIYSAESQVLSAMPRMIKKASSAGLKEAFELHLRQTEEQVTRLEQVAKNLDISLKGKKCRGMEGLLEEGKEMLEAKAEPLLRDVALVAAAQKVEHYEIAAYGNLVAMANELGLTEEAALLQETLDEEKDTDEKLTEVCQEEVLEDLRTTEGGLDDEEDRITAR